MSFIWVNKSYEAFIIKLPIFIMNVLSSYFLSFMFDMSEASSHVNNADVDEELKDLEPLFSSQSSDEDCQRLFTSWS